MDAFPGIQRSARHQHAPDFELYEQVVRERDRREGRWAKEALQGPNLLLRLGEPYVDDDGESCAPLMLPMLLLFSQPVFADDLSPNGCQAEVKPEDEPPPRLHIILKAEWDLVPFLARL